MKVDNPRFHDENWLFPNAVECEDCPFDDDDVLCSTECCPDIHCYESACRVAGV